MRPPLSLPPGPDRRQTAILALLFLLYLALGFAGYGNDNDTYGMLKTWSDLYLHGTYSPSRAPGYPLPEIAIGAAAQVGGHPAANALSALLACGSLFLFHRLLRRAAGPGPSLAAVLAAGLNPHFVIAASSAMDYVHALFYFLAGLSALCARRPAAAGLLFALAAASRLTYAPLIALAYAAAWPIARSSPGRPLGLARLAASSGFGLLLAVLAYLPAWRAMGPAMFKPTLSDRPISLVSLEGFPDAMAYAARFVYKNVQLWGLPAFLVLAAGSALALFLRGRNAARMPAPADRDAGDGGTRSGGAGSPATLPRPALLGVLAALLYVEALFFRLPLEIAYLLPALFLVLLPAARVARAVPLLLAVAACHAVHGIAAVDFLEKTYARKSYESVEASGARVRLHVAPGPVLEDRAGRPEAQRHYFRVILGDSSGTGRNLGL